MALVLVLAATLAAGATAYAGTADILPKGDAGLNHVQVAEECLHAFLEIIPQIQQEDGEFGFAETDSLDDVCLGVPYRLHRINSQALSDYQEGDTVSSVISKTQTWYFPVMLDDRIKALLMVDKVKGRWKAVGFGKANLSSELEGVRKNWPASKGYRPLLIIFQAREYLYTVPEKGAYNLTSLTFREDRMPLEDDMNLSAASAKSRLSNVTDVIDRLKSFSENNLKTEQAKPVTGKRARSARSSTDPMGSASLYLGSYPQKCDWWCWAACSQAVLAYYGESVSQQEIADFETNGACAGIESLGRIAYVLNNFYSSLYRFILDGVITPSDAWDEINADEQPFFIEWDLPGIVGNHTVVAYAYVHVDPNMCAFCPSPNEPMLAIMNPADGDRALHPYSWVLDGSIGDQPHIWLNTLVINQ